MNYILNLDEQFTPLNGTFLAYQKINFSGGEPHLVIKDTLAKGSEVSITTRIKKFEDLGFLCLAVDALKRMNVKLNQLILPYFLGARQDRIMNPGEALTVKVYADIINQFQFEEVIVFDAHSDVTAAVIDKVKAVNNHRFIDAVLNDLRKEQLALVSPDGGALKKIYKLAEHVGITDVIECSKHRDTTTRKLHGFKI